ncbi:DUF6461 domain-containing protein [Nocardioides KLBMP 9356]|uniref:DUF6461 domain-containing protein n=1 Tax=Nocardioides potassii TaxID=2911371 RepID=A0ABS9HDJ8_9ACTN|nr:DUF6461 domain-containing protein [Nocardioides potassii]MCF6379211.1 DUF6461 domain-containing protein [Nocardioides potassii]
MRPGGRRAYAVVLMVGVLGAPGCGVQDSPEVAQEPTPSEATTTISKAPAKRPPLDRTELDAHLAALSSDDRALVDHYLEVERDENLGEGTWVVTAPLTVEEAKRRLLGLDARPMSAAERERMGFEKSAYTFVQVGDGVVAYEDTGFADPPKRLLAALSEDGAVSAVATDNIEAMTRFGYARDGKVVYDNYEYAFEDDLDDIPLEVRDLARLARVDPKGPMVETASWSAVALAMSEKVTGVRAVRPGWETGDWYVVPVPWGVSEDY